MLAPPFLRFQLYFMGLPKTASTSLTEVFGDYRTSHEWDMHSLSWWGVARQSGQIDDETVRRMLGLRLSEPSLEFDACTSLHWFASLLANDFPNAKFVHAIRDVQSWTQSLLDMEYRRWVRSNDWSIQPWEAALRGHFFGAADPWGEPGSDERLLVIAMRAWADHMSRMELELPPERTVTIRTENLDQDLPTLAALVNVPLNRIAARPVANARPSELTFDRWAASDRTVLLAVYDQDCAKHMAKHFPAEHRQLRSWLQQPQADGIADLGGPDWKTYVSRTARWAAGQEAANASDIGRSPNPAEIDLALIGHDRPIVDSRPGSTIGRSIST